MCVELLCKPDASWRMKYVAGSIAETDAPPTLVDLIKQVQEVLRGKEFPTCTLIFLCASPLPSSAGDGSTAPSSPHYFTFLSSTAC